MIPTLAWGQMSAGKVFSQAWFVSIASDILDVPGGRLFGRSVGYEVHFVSGLTLKF